jgi:hypothetical protein
MSSSATQPPTESRDAAYWAQPVSKLGVSDVPSGAMNLNVKGRQVSGALQGFGQMWQKTYKVRLSGANVAPVEVVKVWKENFPKFWPKGNRFYGPIAGIAPGEVAVLNLAGPGNITGPGGMPLISTGVMVIYSDDESFTFMTPEGHIVAGWITFSAYEEDGSTVAQAQVLIRPSDPLYELTFRLGIGHKTEDDFWQHTVKAVAAHFGVDGQPQQEVTLVDPKVQWSQAKNIWRNAGIRTGLYIMATPLRWVGNLFKRGGNQ